MLNEVCLKEDLKFNVQHKIQKRLSIQIHTSPIIFPLTCSTGMRFCSYECSVGTCEVSYTTCLQQTKELLNILTCSLVMLTSPRENIENGTSTLSFD